MSRMLRLILMRHSKAEPARAGTGDHGRALSERGCADAVAAGRALAALARPDFALVSDSARTLGTFERVAQGLPPLPHRATRRLYGATPETIVSEIRKAPGEARTILVVGHNPGIGDLARRLAGVGRSPASTAEAALAAHFPTSCFAILGFAAEAWEAVEGAGRLDHLWPLPGADGA